MARSTRGNGRGRSGGLIRSELGNAELDRWYAAVGSAFFNDGVKTHMSEVHEELLRANGFDPALVERAIADQATSDDVRADHEHAAVTYGAHGVPTIVFASDDAVYGPVVVPAPTGKDALALWELVRSMQLFPHLYELRRPKTTADLVHIGEQFRTYLTTRDWNTVENEAP